MKKNAYEINHINATIYMTKKFYKAACTLNTPEYKELIAARRDNPTYKMEVREIKKATNIMIKTIESHHGSVNTTANMVRIYWVHSTKSSIMTLLSIL